MSQFKIFIQNNYLFIQCDEPVYTKQAPSKNVVIQPVDSTNPVEYDFFNFDNEKTKWATIKLADMVDENDTPYDYNTWTEFYTKNTGNFNTAGGGSSATEKNGIANVTIDAGENFITFFHGLPGANWAILQYKDPEMGQVYLSDINIDTSEVTIASDNVLPAGTYTIFYKVAIV